ncbi:hypothetical protein NP233_g3544 [Leucocoprinus birnbaumii]|uniref:Ornithine decarboxylase antizyme n=1 Tax=Leucocoprinus birnbaumii TaxID=56174 RepID=A0AAD5VX25_9AGAR|nr:hypothetical protein NP233_g3544 [Leucocoprinus birnbaumii]
MKSVQNHVALEIVAVANGVEVPYLLSACFRYLTAVNGIRGNRQDTIITCHLQEPLSQLGTRVRHGAGEWLILSCIPHYCCTNTRSNSLEPTPLSNYQVGCLRPTNARQSVGDGAASFDTSVPSVLAVCQLEGNDDMYYYSTTFSGGPGSKCPPDRGSSDCVTGGPASYFSSSPPSSISSSPTSFSSSPTSALGTRAFSKTFSYSPTTAAPITTIDYTHGKFQQPFLRNSSARTAINTSNPRAIPTPTRSGSNASSSGLSTPPLTPDDGSYSSSGSIDSIAFDPIRPHGYPSAGPKAGSAAPAKDALDYLMTIFPKDGLKVLPHAKSVTISAPTLGAAFEGVVLQLPGKPKTLYVDGKNAALVSLRESIVALLDLASENLDCDAMVIVLERSAPNLGELLHSLMYVGGAVVTKSPFAVDPAFVLVGLEI